MMTCFDDVTTRRDRDLGGFQELASKACQTPVSWWTLQAASSVKEACPGDAPTRSGILTDQV